MSWQIVPQRLYDLIAESPRVAAAVTAEMYTQRRLDTERFEAVAAVARA